MRRDDFPIDGLADLTARAHRVYQTISQRRGIEGEKAPGNPNASLADQAEEFFRVPSNQGIWLADQAEEFFDAARGYANDGDQTTAAKMVECGVEALDQAEHILADLRK
jgi:hypothetical protein